MAVDSLTATTSFGNRQAKEIVRNGGGDQGDNAIASATLAAIAHVVVQ
ncbi:MAG: hypothetical protein ACRDJH_02250 [Thermomicrobiales bacterium]